MEIVYILVALAAALAIYFLFFRKPAEPERRPPSQERLAEKPGRPGPSERQPEAGAQDASVEHAAPAPQSAVEITEREAPEEARRSLTPARDVQQIRKGLARSRSDDGLFGKLKSLFTGKQEISADIAEEIEEILLASDVGVQTTQAILDRVRETLNKSDLLDSSKVWEALRGEAKRILEGGGEPGAFKLPARPTVVIMVGVNGSGKTTTIGKLATKLKAEGRECVLAAGDTFRAAAVQQLTAWGRRVGCEVVRGKEGADPGSVTFDAVKKGQELEADVVLTDTAGRLHTKKNLMAEMQKIIKTTGKAMAGAPHEVLLVIDATNGQNALAQAKQFKEELPVTGIVLTKLDGTAKGGVILGICDTLQLPVRFIGLGERPGDLHDFSPDEFVEALLGQESEASAA